MLDRNVRIDDRASRPPGAYADRSTSCRAASPISRRSAKRSTMRRKGKRGLNFHDARGTLVRAYPYSELREDALGACPPLRRARRQAGRPDRADRRDRARIRRLLLRRGLCRRLAGAAAAADHASAARDSLYRPARRPADERRPDSCCSIPPELADMAGAAAERQGVDGARLGQLRRASSRPTADAARRPSPTTSPICNIRAARPASRTASRSPTARCSTTSRAHGHRHERRRRRPLHLLAALVPRHGPGRLLAVADRATRCRSTI